VRFFATCAKGTEGALRRELSVQRLAAIAPGRGGVRFDGAFEAGMLVCLHSRVAVRVLLELGAFSAPSAEALYEGARALQWTEWLTTRTTFAVAATVRDSAIAHSMFAALKVKDAVADALRARFGSRPDVDPKDPDVRIALHLANDEATIYLDLAGEPLHRRGYRVQMTDAPLKETLAAAVLALGRIDPASTFVDPMCGSGTLVIEQALRSRNLAPGLGRAFGFERWPGFSGPKAHAWQRLRDEARAVALAHAPAPIIAGELWRDALDAARHNARAAGVEHDVRFALGDARDRVPCAAEGTLCMNPPYGERLMSARPRAREDRPDHRPSRKQAFVAGKKLEGLYSGLGEMLDRHHGWTAIVLSGSPLFRRAYQRPPEIEHKLWNGPIETRLLRYRVP
jgi:23S rRNA G2445 N2-methylase RlmL